MILSCSRKHRRVLGKGWMIDEEDHGHRHHTEIEIAMRLIDEEIRRPPYTPP